MHCVGRMENLWTLNLLLHEVTTGYGLNKERWPHSKARSHIILTLLPPQISSAIIHSHTFKTTNTKYNTRKIHGSKIYIHTVICSLVYHACANTRWAARQGCALHRLGRLITLHLLFVITLKIGDYFSKKLSASLINYKQIATGYKKDKQQHKRQN